MTPQYPIHTVPTVPIPKHRWRTAIGPLIWRTLSTLFFAHLPHRSKQS